MLRGSPVTRRVELCAGCDHVFGAVFLRMRPTSVSSPQRGFAGRDRNPFSFRILRGDISHPAAP